MKDKRQKEIDIDREDKKMSFGLISLCLSSFIKCFISYHFFII
jgi:hypothetical protein